MSARPGASNGTVGRSSTSRYGAITDTNTSPAHGAVDITPAGIEAAAAAAKGIHFSSPPQGYNDFATANIPTISQLRHLSPDDIQLDQPIPEYGLHGTVTQEGTSNELVFEKIYYYGVHSSGESKFGLEVGVTYNGSLRFPFNDTQVNAGMQYLSGLEQVQAGSYEARLAMISGMGNAIWLKSKDGGNDLFYTLTNIVRQGNPPSAGSQLLIQSATLLTGSSFLATIGAEAQQN